MDCKWLSMKFQVLLLSIFFCCSLQAMDWNIKRSPEVDNLVKAWCSGNKSTELVRKITELVTRPSGDFDSSLIYGAPELQKLIEKLHDKKHTVSLFFQTYTKKNTTLFFKSIKEYLEMGGSPNNVYYHGNTLLHLLCMINSSKYIEIIKYLLKQKNIKPDIKNCRKQTPLYVACENLSTEAIKLLMLAGARTELTCYSGCTTWREVLHEAILKNRHESAMVALEMGPMVLPGTDEIAKRLNKLSDEQMLNWYNYV